METNNNIHELLSNRMAWDNSDIDAPSLSQLSAARSSVMARKKTAVQKKDFLSGLISFLHFDLKFYHLGISVMLLMIGSFYVTETHYGVAGGPVFNEHSANALSLKSSTISVNSSTMLTSIPTLRN